MDSVDDKTTNVDLGFIDTPQHSWLLHRTYFPSKVGGKPAWLDPCNLPSPEELLCETCLKPMLFLLQIYAPNEDDINAFHRTVYIFCCKNGSCYKEEENCPIKVIRCCLPRKNLYYSFDPPQYNNPVMLKYSKEPESLCKLCGCRGNKICSRCKSTSYCHKYHQTLDWKRHKLECNKTDKDIGHSISSDELFPENEIVMEAEELKLKLEEVKIKLETGSDLDEAELSNAVNAQNEDKAFMKFNKRLSHNMEQVIRYERGGKPLWCSDKHILNAEDVPLCNCGSPRIYEFQIMPQLLNFLHVDTSIGELTMDWGTMAVYTCSMNCSPGLSKLTSTYVKEFVWKQNYSK